MTKRRVVITDASVVTAAGIGKKDFFRNLSNGVSGIRPIQRFETSYLATKQGGEVNLSNLVLPPTIPGRKPWDRISDTKGVLAWNALLQISNSIPSDAAFFSAVGLERVSVDDLIKSIPRASMVCPEVPPTVLSGLLWRLLGLQGPVSTQVTACAAGTIAIGAAMRAIRRGRFECAVAGGVDSLIFPYGIHSFNSLDALSERNDLGPAALSPFDLNRSGTLLGEGAAYLVLEEASFAEKRGKIPLAEVIGYGASMDAFHAVMPKPDGSGAKKAMEAALKDADLSPDSIEYINAHGTGTYHNDGMEARAILSLFGERGKTIPTSSIKPFIGHLLSAAGAVETVASLLPFVHGIIPPTLHFKTPDPECPIYCVPNNSISANPDIIMKNSYGLGGQNASLILGKIGIS